jgi:Zn finger protein HypA/HybF involved in hydrogenase expression
MVMAGMKKYDLKCQSCNWSDSRTVGPMNRETIFTKIADQFRHCPKCNGKVKVTRNYAIKF